MLRLFFATEILKFFVPLLDTSRQTLSQLSNLTFRQLDDAADVVPTDSAMPNIPNISKFWQYMNQASTYFLEKGSALTTAEVTAKLQETEGLIIK